MTRVMRMMILSRRGNNRNHYDDTAAAAAAAAAAAQGDTTVATKRLTASRNGTTVLRVARSGNIVIRQRLVRVFALLLLLLLLLTISTTDRCSISVIRQQPQQERIRSSVAVVVVDAYRSVSNSVTTSRRFGNKHTTWNAPLSLQRHTAFTVQKRTNAIVATTATLTFRKMSNTDDNQQFRPETNFGGSDLVPEAQRPINEYLDVTNQPFFTWARDSNTNANNNNNNAALGLYLRFLVLYGILFVTICYPISEATFTTPPVPELMNNGGGGGGDSSFPTDSYLIHKLVSSNVGATFVSLLLLFRIYSGYDYIGQRLQSPNIEYEETGWYDGDIEPKSTTELLRDRMLYMDQVEPIVRRLKRFVVAGTTYFVASIIALNVVLTQYPIMFDQYDPTVLNRLSYDDKLADTAATSANGQPAYCDSRYYRAIANGGLGCK